MVTYSRGVMNAFVGDTFIILYTQIVCIIRLHETAYTIIPIGLCIIHLHIQYNISNIYIINGWNAVVENACIVHMELSSGGY